MIEEELRHLIQTIQRRGCEGQTTEVKAAHQGCPKKLYDTLSSFSNQDEGGVLVFGLDESNGFEKVGVYNAQELQKRVMEYAEQMTPIVRPVFTVCDEDGRVFVSAEIPPCDIAERPCFQAAKGRISGSYKRVGDADKPMTEYEVYSYEAFRKRIRDDIRPIQEATLKMLDESLLNTYRSRMRNERPNLTRISEEQQDEFNGITCNGNITMAALLLFGLFPQAFFPRLCISATRIAGKNMGETDAQGRRFIDTKHIEGTITDMLKQALDFVRNNMRTSTRIDPLSGRRTDVPEYPMEAVREAVLNALVHRDYSIYTESKPIQLNMYDDRLEITNPGGLYGRLTVDQLGHVQPDTRNPILATALEILRETENRYSGIPTIREFMKQRHLPEPVFINNQSEFSVTLYNEKAADTPADRITALHIQDEKNLLDFCRTPRTRAEIIAHLGLGSGQYALHKYLDPLLAIKAIRMTIPQTPRSRNQKFVTEDL